MSQADRSSAAPASVTEPSHRTIQSVDRALTLVRLLSSEDGEMTLNELAETTRLHKSTVHRLLASMQAVGLVERDPETGRYALGLEVVALSGIVLGRIEVLRIADPHMRNLADVSQETVNLGIRHSNDILNIEQIPGPRLLRSFDWIGKRNPLHLGAAAKALLANLQDDEISTYLATQTEREGLDETAIWDEVAKIRERGIAINDGQLDRDVFAIGAPIFGAAGHVIASLSVAGARVDFTPDRIAFLTTAVLETTATISRQMGYRNLHVAQLA